ncbi:MAG: TolC family protein [Bryobacteraceae bacterium]
MPVPRARPELLGGPLSRYRPYDPPPISFADSPRLDPLIRAGNLYLTLRDAIALAIENNLDVELQRLTPLLAEADLQRTLGGAVALGVPINVREGPTGLGGAAPSQSPFEIISAAPGAAGEVQTDVGLSPTSVSVGALTSGIFITGGPPVPNLDPALAGSVGWNRSNRPQASPFITGTNALSATSAFGDLRFQQGFLSGGTATVGLDGVRQDTNNLRADINPSTAGGLVFAYVQPLLRGFRVAVNNRFIRIARNNRQVSDLTFEEQVINTVHTVIRLYWDLVSLNNTVRVQIQSLDLAERLLSDNIEQERAGTLAPIEVVRARAEVASARRDLTIAETRVRQQETILKDYITRGIVDAQRLATIRVIPTDTIAPPREMVEPLQDLTAAARMRRPELARADIQVENSKIALTGSRSALLPSLDLVVNARSNVLYGQVNPLPPATGDASPIPFERNPDPAFVGGPGTGLAQIFSGRFPDYGLELHLNIPLFNRVAQADHTRNQLSLRQQEIRFRQLEKQVGVDVVNAQIAVQQARAAHDAAQQARVLQEQSLEAEREKFAAGVSTNFLLIQYQRDLAQALSAEVVALADYVKARAALDRATGRLLDEYDISLVDAYRGRMPDTP